MSDDHGTVVGKVLQTHTDDDSVPGLAWAVSVGDEVQHGSAGRVRIDGEPVRLDTIFRISSMSKPVTGAATMLLVDDGVLALDDPVDTLLPELADRQVLAPGAASLTDTVPAERPITVRDLLTFRMGIGMDFSDWSPNLVLAAAAELGLGAGPPAPWPTTSRLPACSPTAASSCCHRNRSRP